MLTFDLTPDPKILIALTHTPMQPMDALCELIDNALDSFQAAVFQGNAIKDPLVIVNLPRLSELNSGVGRIQVRDNGSGLNSVGAEKALRAGFSGNNPYDSLGLFGMGFNISTGKLGRSTKFLTACAGAANALEAVVDLDVIIKSRSYEVHVDEVTKPSGFERGTLIEISGWWPEGNQNSGFVRKLIQYGVPKVREEIGRRYASILKEKGVQIVVNNEVCQPFEHCVWADSRFVERKTLGKIPAVFRFNQLIGSQSRCIGCTALVDPGSSKCQACGSSNLRTVEERIRGGWEFSVMTMRLNLALT
jgi:ribosomal protein L40E